MDVREKLVELVGQVQDCGCDVTDVVEMNYVENITLVDHLIAHGVTVQEWISVKDRLPEYEDKVLVCNSENGSIHTAELDGELWHLDCGWLLDVDDFTHWMTLPQPPKGE